MFGRATIRLGIGPHSSYYYIVTGSLGTIGIRAEFREHCSQF